MGTMLDTVGDPAATFRGLKFDAIAAYGNGKFANYDAAHKEFPHLHVLKIDVKGEGIGNAGDFEAGDMAFANAGHWAKGRIAAGIHRPVVYFSVANYHAVIESLHAAGVNRADVRIWTAHYDGRPHLCSSACQPGMSHPADATQWGSPQAPGTLPAPFAGHNVDVSMTADDFFASR